MITYEELVDGKTIAIVGPAPAPYDQSAEVDAHDLVFRTSYGFRSKPEGFLDDGSEYVSGHLTPGYGTRVDVSFYNTQGVRFAIAGKLDDALKDLKFALWKQPKPFVPDRKLCGERVVDRPKKKGRDINVNQVTAILWDLRLFRPADVTVFGADFYTSPIEKWYDPAYVHREGLGDQAKLHVESVIQHDQEAQREVVRHVRELKGWPNGDDRYIKALNMTPEEHLAVLRGIDVNQAAPAWAANTTPDALIH